MSDRNDSEPHSGNHPGPFRSARFTPPLPFEEGAPESVLRVFTLKPRLDSGLACVSRVPYSFERGHVHWRVDSAGSTRCVCVRERECVRETWRE